MRAFLTVCFSTLAITAFPQVLELSTEEALALRRIVDFWEEGEYQIAKNQMEDFLAEFSENPYSDTLRMALGDLFLREKNYQTALNYYAQIADRRLADQAMTNRMQCLYHLQWHATLADECEAYLQRNPEYSTEKERLEATYFLAIALYQQCLIPSKDEATVKALAERAKPYFEMLASSELSDEVAGASAHLRCILKDYEGASKIYLDLSKKNGPSEELLFQAALIQSKYDKSIALQTFDQIAKQAGSLAQEAAYNELILSFDLGKHEEIICHKESILQAIPKERIGLAHLFIGQSFLALNQYQEAAAELSAFLDANTTPDSIRPALLHLLEAAYCASDLHLLDEAIERLKAFNPLDESLPKALFSRAYLLKKNRQFEEAKAQLRSLLIQYPQFTDRPLVSFEIAHLEATASHWTACREAALFFLQEYSSHELSAFAWRYVATSSIQLANQAKEFKAQCIQDLENFLQSADFLSPSERLDFQFQLAKVYFETGSIAKCSALLQSSLQNETSFDHKANAKLLYALCEREDREFFCNWAEAALCEGADLLPITDQHLALFNAYLARSEEYLEPAALHLYKAFQCKADIQLSNLLWLANYAFEKFEQIPDQAQCAFEVISYLLANHPQPMTQDTLYLEPLYLKAAKLYRYFGDTEASIACLKTLNDQYISNPSLSWNVQNEAKLFLAESILQNGQTGEAQVFFDEISSSALLKDRFAAAASLQSARLKRSLENPDYPSILSKLKDLVLQKKLENEPIHLEAALEYIDLQTQLETPEKKPNKRLYLLEKMKNEFQAQEDLLSRDYHAARMQLKEQNRTYLAYMDYLDAQILLTQSELQSDPERQKELQAKAKDILLQMETGAPAQLRLRLQGNEGK